MKDDLESTQEDREVDYKKEAPEVLNRIGISFASLFPIEIQSSILLGGTAQGKEKEPDKIFTFTIPSNQARLIKSLLEQNEDLQRELANSDQMNSDSQNIKDSKKEKASKKKKSSIYRSMRDPFQGKFFLGIIGIGCIKNLDTKPDRTRDLLGNGKI
ncbi:hypothetical protein ACJX0J_003372 (mitochondrion) [Zea mays]